MQGKECQTLFLVHEGISAPQVHHRALSSHALQEQCSLFLVQSVLKTVCHVLQVRLTTVSILSGKYHTALGKCLIFLFAFYGIGKFCAHHGLSEPTGRCQDGYHCPSGSTSPNGTGNEVYLVI